MPLLACLPGNGLRWITPAWGNRTRAAVTSTSRPIGLKASKSARGGPGHGRQHQTRDQPRTHEGAQRDHSPAPRAPPRRLQAGLTAAEAAAEKGQKARRGVRAAVLEQVSPRGNQAGVLVRDQERTRNISHLGMSPLRAISRALRYLSHGAARYGAAGSGDAGRGAARQGQARRGRDSPRHRRQHAQVHDQGHR